MESDPSASTREGLVQQAERARISIKLLYKCFLFLSTCLLFLNIGLRQSVTRLELYRIEVKADLDLQLGHISREQRADQKLTSLTHIPFGKSFRDSHASCLVRGINIVEAHFKPHSYAEYPYVRNEVINWVQTNCDKQMFNLQVKQQSPEIAILTRWARFSQETKRFVQLMKVALADFTAELMMIGRAPRTLPQRSIKQAAELQPGDTHSKSSLPREFQLLGCEQQHCRLVYNPHSGRPNNKAPGKDTLEFTMRRLSVLSSSKRYFGLAHDSISILAAVLDSTFVLMHAILVYRLVTNNLSSTRNDHNRLIDIIPYDLYVQYMCRTCITVASIYLPRIPHCISVGLIMAALTALFTFCTPGVMFPDVLDFRFATKEWFSIIQDLRTRLQEGNSTAQLEFGHGVTSERDVHADDNETERRFSGDTTLDDDLEDLRAGRATEGTTQTSQLFSDEASDYSSGDEDSTMEDIDLGSDGSTVSDWSLLGSD